ncbi:hypothetical protein AAAC51_03885 [Priestia megaterium]
MKRKWISLLALLLVVGAGIGGIKIYQKPQRSINTGLSQKKQKSG